MKISEEKLFVETGGLSDVVLNWFGNPIEWFDFYAKAYHSSARALFDRLSQDELRDVGACPIIFLNRHSLELRLKEILIRGHWILRLDAKPFRTAEEILTRHGKHRLSALWDDLKDFYKQIGWEWEDQLDAYGAIVKEFDELDPKSFGFRYPVEKSGCSALCENFRFDLKHFCDKMNEVIARLDAISCAMAGAADHMSQNED